MTTAPPSPALMFLEVWKLNVPRSPSAPTRRPRHSAPCACAASSMIATPWSRPSAANASMSQGRPATCTGITALVRPVSLVSVLAGSSRWVSGSRSAKTGTAPTNVTAAALAMNVYGGTTTSSPTPTPAARSAATRASVPLQTHTQCAAPWNAANSASNASVREPCVLPQLPEVSTSPRASASDGSEVGQSGNGRERTGAPPWTASGVVMVRGSRTLDFGSRPYPGVVSTPTFPTQVARCAMDQAGKDDLAVDGGVPVRSSPFPSVGNASGRTLGEEELEGLRRVLASGQLNSTTGGETRALEAEFAAYYGVGAAVASSSGTAALHLAVAAVDPEPGDEIITTPITDAGTVLPILMQNAVPVFADVDPVTGNLDVDSVRRAITSRTRAICVVHLFGSPAPVAALRRLADAHGLVLIEDCAQAYLTRCPDGRLAGTVGDIGCFSLQQSKHITAGDGGLCISDNPALARRMRLFADKGWPRDTDERTHLFLSTNYRMTELQAAVARAQLLKLAGVVGDRRAGAQRLSEALRPLAGLCTPPDEGGMSYWQYPLVVDPALAGGTCHDYGKALAAEGIPANGGYLTRPVYRTPVLAERRTYGESGYPLSVPPAREVPRYDAGLCPVAESLIDERLLVLSWNERYTGRDVDDIATAVTKVHRAFTR